MRVVYTVVVWVVFATLATAVQARLGTLTGALVIGLVMAVVLLRDVIEEWWS